MEYENYKRCKLIDAIDVVVSHLVGDKESLNALFEKGTDVSTTFEKLMDMRNDLEKQIFLSTHPEYEKVKEL